jgi:hypothetical protein
MLVVSVEEARPHESSLPEPQHALRETHMSDSGEITLLRLHPRQTETVPLAIPTGTLETIRNVAETRDMSPEALMRFYIGQGLRQDTARLFSERILDMTERVLARHIPSESERSAILREIRGEAAA